MNITLNRKNKGLLFEASDENGISVLIDGGANSLLGEGKSLSPMQLVLSAVAGCSVFDVVTILHKQKQDLLDIQVQAHAERSDAVPAIFETIHLHFVLIGDLNEKKVQRALKLSVEKYCSVGKMIGKSAIITYDYEINQQ